MNATASRPCTAAQVGVFSQLDGWLKDNRGEGGVERLAGREEKKDSHTEGETEKERQGGAEKHTKERRERSEPHRDQDGNTKRSERHREKHTQRNIDWARQQRWKWRPRERS